MQPNCYHKDGTIVFLLLLLIQLLNTKLFVLSDQKEGVIIHFRGIYMLGRVLVLRGRVHFCFVHVDLLCIWRHDSTFLLCIYFDHFQCI
jgi:hypothetical protein